MDDQLNVPLEDVELLDEVELTTNLIIAASEAEGELPQVEIDRLLGVDEGGAGHLEARRHDGVPHQVRHTA